VKEYQEKDKIRTKPDKNEKPTPTEPIDSLSMGDEHLNTIPATESNEFIKSCVENFVPNPSESEGENECDVPAGFTTFSNVLFDADYDSDSSDDQSLSDEDVREKIYSNPLFDEEIIPMEIDQHSFNAESNLIGSMPNHDSSVIISSKIDSLFDKFAGELTLLKSFPPGIHETDCHPEKEIRLTQRLLYDNSSPRPPEEIVSDISNADIESFSPSPIPNKDGDPLIEEIDLYFNLDDPMPPENIKLLNIEVKLRDTALVTLRHKLEKAELERDDLKLKLEKFQTLYKNLIDLLASQTNEKSRFQPSGGYHAVPPPYTKTFMPHKPDLVFNTAPTDVETDHLTFNVQLSHTKPKQELSHTTRPSAPFIDDWVSDSEEESETKA
nr:hypothetical protein [Tanacetum cinerariifolium]